MGCAFSATASDSFDPIARDRTKRKAKRGKEKRHHRGRARSNARSPAPDAATTGDHEQTPPLFAIVTDASGAQRDPPTPQTASGSRDSTVIPLRTQLSVSSRTRTSSRSGSTARVRASVSSHNVDDEGAQITPSMSDAGLPSIPDRSSNVSRNSDLLYASRQSSSTSLLAQRPKAPTPRVTALVTNWLDLLDTAAVETAARPADECSAPPGTVHT